MKKIFFYTFLCMTLLSFTNGYSATVTIGSDDVYAYSISGDSGTFYGTGYFGITPQNARVRAFVEFNLDSWYAEQINPAQITSVELRLTEYPTTQHKFPFNFYSMKTDYADGTAVESDYYSSTDYIITSAIYSLNLSVTEKIKDDLAASNDYAGFVFIHGNEGGANYSQPPQDWWYSTGQYAPQLVITYSETPVSSIPEPTTMLLMSCAGVLTFLRKIKS